MRLLPLATFMTFAVVQSAAVPLLSAQSNPTPAETDPAKTALIHRLLVLTRATELVVSSIEGAIPAQRLANPEIPAEFWDEFAARARADTARFMRMLVPIYARHLSREHLEGLVAFYETPVGRHLAEVQPQLTRESMTAGQQWGAQLGAEVGADLAERGIRVP